MIYKERSMKFSLCVCKKLSASGGKLPLTAITPRLTLNSSCSQEKRAQVVTLSREDFKSSQALKIKSRDFQVKKVCPSDSQVLS